MNNCLANPVNFRNFNICLDTWGKTWGILRRKGGPFKYYGNTAAAPTALPRCPYRHIDLIKCDS